LRSLLLFLGVGSAVLFTSVLLFCSMPQPQPVLSGEFGDRVDAGLSRWRTVVGDLVGEVVAEAGCVS
jgi:hypothetical protein